MRTPTAALFAISLLSACVDPGYEEEEVTSGQEAITPGAPAVDWMVRRAAKPKPCTATLIGRRYVLTALHCVQSGYVYPGYIRFYDDASGFSTAADHKVKIAAAYSPPGTDFDSDTTDLQGRTADMSILRLEADAPASSVAATLAWEYPGAGVQGFRVGAGGHNNGAENPTGALLYRAGNTAIDETVSGSFWLEDTHVDGNDSGGPFYVDYRVMGVLRGHTIHDMYTSVPDQLPWMLDTIAWSWTHGPSIGGIYRAGVSLGSFVAATEKVCQYACDRTGACGAYNYAPAYDVCELVQNPNDVVSSSFFRSALK